MVLLALTLGGCVTLLPKAPAVQLYRFGPPLLTATTTKIVVPGGTSPGIVLADLRLPPSASGDGVLTITGDQAAYIAGARWLEPASKLFQADVEAAFAAHSRGVLLDRAQSVGASGVLSLDVTRFETRYTQGSESPPTVSVRLRATLARPDGRTAVVREFSAEQSTGADRVSDIVAAYDTAVGRVLFDLVHWVDFTTPPSPDALRPSP